MNDKPKEEIKELKALTKRIAKTAIRKGKRRAPRNRRKLVRRSIKPRTDSNLFGVRGESLGIPTTPNEFRNLRHQDLLSAMQTYHQFTKARYLMGLVHPDIAVEDSIPIKLFSDVPIPTASIGFKETYQFSTNASGAFLLGWVPNFLLTNVELNERSSNDYSHLTFNNSVALVGTGNVPGNFFVPGSYAPAIDLQRYRMVSALLKVQYNGSILNQAGTMFSCATFDPLNACTGSTTFGVNTFTQTLMDRFGNFGLIQNGLWNRTINITHTSEGLECLYVPIDPDDLTFQRMGSFFGVIVPTNGLVNCDAEGAHIAYLVAGRNLPASASCIIVTIYYNFEVIADPSAAPLLRSSSTNLMSSSENRSLGDSLSDMIKSNGLIRPVANRSSNDILHSILTMGMEYLPKLPSLLTKVGSLIGL